MRSAPAPGERRPLCVLFVPMKRSFQATPGTAGPLFAMTAVALIAATYGLARFGYGLFLPQFSGSFALTPTIGGLLSSGASIVYCLAAAVGFRYAPHHPRAVTILAGSSASLGSAGIAASTVTPAFAASVLLAGMGAGFASPSLVELVRRNVTESRQDRLQSVVNSGTGFGVVAAGLLALALSTSWRLAWALIAVVTLASMIGVLMTDSSRARTAPGRQHHGFRARGTRWLDLRPLAHPVLAAFAYGTGCAALWIHGRTLLEQQGGMTTTSSAVVWIALGAGGAAAVLTAPWLARHSVRTTWTITVCATAGATGAIAAHPGSTAFSFAAAALFGLAYTAATSVLIIWATQTATSSAAGTSVLFTSLVLGQAAGSTLTGSLIDAAGFVPAFAVAAATSLIGAIGFLRPARSRTSTARSSDRLP